MGWLALHLGTHFMPKPKYYTLLHMLATPPGKSITKVNELLLVQDRILKTFPRSDNGFWQCWPGQHRNRSGVHRAERVNNNETAGRRD